MLQLLRLVVLVSADSGCRLASRRENHLASQSNWIAAWGLTKFIRGAKDFVLMSILAGSGGDTLQWHRASSRVAAPGLSSLWCWRWQHMNLCWPKLGCGAEPKLFAPSPYGHRFDWNPVAWSFSGKRSARFPLLFVLTVGVKAFPSTRTVTVYSWRDGDSVSPPCKRSQKRHRAFVRERLHLPCCPLSRLSVRNRDPAGLVWVDGVLEVTHL